MSMREALAYARRATTILQYEIGYLEQGGRCVPEALDSLVEQVVTTVAGIKQESAATGFTQVRFPIG